MTSPLANPSLHAFSDSLKGATSPTLGIWVTHAMLHRASLLTSAGIQLTPEGSALVQIEIWKHISNLDPGEVLMPAGSTPFHTINKASPSMEQLPSNPFLLNAG
jgi:hypothetical protein